MLKSLLAESITDTPEFKRWFGGSKVVDKHGNLLVVFHGTTKSFSKFDDSKVGSSTDPGYLGRGFYFTNNTEMADHYARTGKKEGSNIMPVYLKIENPANSAILFKLNKYDISVHLPPEQIVQVLKKNGYDGIIQDVGNGYEFVVFSPDQIKSAYGNR